MGWRWGTSLLLTLGALLDCKEDVDIEADVAGWAQVPDGVRNRGVCKPLLPPGKVLDDRVWDKSVGRVVAAEFGAKIGEGREVGATVSVDEGDVAEGAMDFLDVVEYR